MPSFLPRAIRQLQVRVGATAVNTIVRLRLLSTKMTGDARVKSW
jgi:hypothetical protein